ncbi:translesion DNA synthesis-associated protein ImuA [Rhodoferax sp. GW822-FHT02A01]|uniref:translesion DNA synthesis-associated protein ImuA n=1 Tax=Rhodoferax sp. GW822-FHT02A01 TaxID=3141537 RepID=UPI00315DBEE5
MSALARTSADSLHGIHADVWHAHALASPVQQVQATGDAVLDAQLPGGGWPVGALTEILQPVGVHCEWRLLLPALAHCGQGPVVLVAPPHVPFVPALAAQGLVAHRLLSVGAQPVGSRLWACEQALRCADVDAVLAWLPQVRSDQLRRLQMAAAEHSKLLFVMRPASAFADASPAALRLQVQPQQEADALQIHLLKRRGPPLDKPLHLQARSARMQVQLASSQAYALDRTAAFA